MARLAVRARTRPVAPAKKSQRRLRKEARIAEMAERSIPLLAEHGFGISTRQLAAGLGVTQALIYKHFSGKDALVAAALERAFARKGDRTRAALLSDPALPLAARLAAYYVRPAAKADDGSRIRLFMRAALENWPFPGRRGAELTHDVFGPVIDALRREAGLLPVADKPMMRGEREVAMMLHASIVFLGIRRHIYNMQMPADRQAIIELYAEIYVPGALAALRKIHAGELGENFTVEQLRRAASR